MANNINTIVSATINASVNDALINYFNALEEVRVADVARVRLVSDWDVEHDTKSILSKARSKKATAEDFHNAEVLSVNREVIVAGAREEYNNRVKPYRKTMRDSETVVFGKKGSNKANALTDFHKAYVAYRAIYDTNFASAPARECIRACKVMLKVCFGVEFQSAKLSEKCARRIINSIGVRIANSAELRLNGQGNCGVACFNEKQVKVLLIRVFGEILSLNNSEFDNMVIAD